MSINLIDLLSRFHSFEDHENDLAWYKTFIPGRSHFNVIYKPARPGLLFDFARKWNFPDDYVSFLEQHNGAKLFAGALALYGVVEPGRLLKRESHFLYPPSTSTKRMPSGGLILIGSSSLVPVHLLTAIESAWNDRTRLFTCS